MKISIITAVYAAERTVGQAIASVSAQSYGNVEHVVIDGASPDGTMAAIEAARHDGMIVHSERDSGIYDALNKGIARATGDVVGICHADDYFAHNDVLAKVAEAFSDPATEACYGDLDYVAKDNTDRVLRHWVSGAYRPKRLGQGWMPPHPTFFVRREVFERIGSYDTQFRIAADYDFVLRYFSQTTAMPVYIPEVLVKMRVGGESNRSLGRILRKMDEDRRALKRNNVGGVMTLASKNLSKLRQFFIKG